MLDAILAPFALADIRKVLNRFPEIESASLAERDGGAVLTIDAPGLSEWDFDRLDRDIQDLPILRKIALINAGMSAGEQGGRRIYPRAA